MNPPWLKYQEDLQELAALVDPPRSYAQLRPFRPVGAGGWLVL